MSDTDTDTDTDTEAPAAPVLSDDLSACIPRGEDAAEIVTFRLPTVPGTYRINTSVLEAAGYFEGRKVRDADGWDVMAVYSSIVASCWDEPKALYPLAGGDPVDVRFPDPREFGRDLVKHGEACYDVLFRLGFTSYDAVVAVGEALYQRAMGVVAGETKRIEEARATFG
jgi:hypothetical protein